MRKRCIWRRLRVRISQEAENQQSSRVGGRIGASRASSRRCSAGRRHGNGGTLARQSTKHRDVTGNCLSLNKDPCISSRSSSCSQHRWPPLETSSGVERSGASFFVARLVISPVSSDATDFSLSPPNRRREEARPESPSRPQRRAAPADDSSGRRAQVDQSRRREAGGSTRTMADAGQSSITVAGKQPASRSEGPLTLSQSEYGRSRSARRRSCEDSPSAPRGPAPCRHDADRDAAKRRTIAPSSSAMAPSPACRRPSFTSEASEASSRSSTTAACTPNPPPPPNPSPPPGSEQG